MQLLLTIIVVGLSMGAMALGLLRGGAGLRRGCGHPVMDCEGCPRPLPDVCPLEEARWNDA